MKNFGRVESRASRRENKKIKVKLTTTCNENEQQQDANNSAELQTNMDEDDLEDL
jgi:hypothetical protein